MIFGEDPLVTIPYLSLLSENTLPEATSFPGHSSDIDSAADTHIDIETGPGRHYPATPYSYRLHTVRSIQYLKIYSRAWRACQIALCNFGRKARKRGRVPP